MLRLLPSGSTSTALTPFRTCLRRYIRVSAHPRSRALLRSASTTCSIPHPQALCHPYTLRLARACRPTARTWNVQLGLLAHSPSRLLSGGLSLVTRSSMIHKPTLFRTTPLARLRCDAPPRPYAFALPAPTPSRRQLPPADLRPVSGTRGPTLGHAREVAYFRGWPHSGSVTCTTTPPRPS